MLANTDPFATSVLGIVAGLALAAACGFRVFVPLLAACLAARADMLPLSAGFEWVASDSALLIFSVATALEIAAYYVPWIDNLLDTVATPAAAIAGTLVSAPFVVGGAGGEAAADPALGWVISAIVGGGLATTTQLMTVTARAASTLTTGGVANPAVSTAEAGAASAIAGLAIFLPILAGLLVLALLFGIYRIIRRLRRSTTTHTPTTTNQTATTLTVMQDASRHTAPALPDRDSISAR